jgi:hypothetical protein
MTTNYLRVAPAQKIGLFQFWPLLWESLTSHQYKVSSPLDRLEFGEFEEEDVQLLIGFKFITRLQASPDNYSHSITGFTGWAFSYHGAKPLRVIDRFVGGLISQLAAKTKSRVYENRRSSSLGTQDVHPEIINPSTFLRLN